MNMTKQSQILPKQYDSSWISRKFIFIVFILSARACFLDNDEYDKAIADLNEALRLCPGFVDAVTYLKDAEERKAGSVERGG
jgi:hypothetical protein